MPISNPRIYESILVPDDSTAVVGTRRDQATISLERAVLPVEAEPPNPFGQRVYVDTQATAEPETAATEQAITERMHATRYEEGSIEADLESIEIVGRRTGGIQPPALPSGSVRPGTTRELIATPTAPKSTPWLLIGAVAVGAWLLLRK